MLRDSVLSMLSTGVRLLTSLVLFVVLAHAWGPASFGVFMYPYTVAAILVKVVDYGFTLQVARDVGRAPDRASEIVGRALGAKIALLVPTALVTAIVATRMPHGGPYVALLVLLLADAVVGSFALFLNVPLRALGRFDREASVAVGANALYFATTLAAVALGAGPVAVATIFLLARLGFLALAWRSFTAVTGERPRATLDAASLRTTLSRGLPFAIHIVVGTLNLQSDTVLIQHYMGASAVGIYQAGMRLLFGALLIGDALHNVFFASLARVAHHPPALRLLATRMTRQLVTLGVLGFALLVGAGGPLVHLLFAHEYAPLASLVPLFGLVALVRYAGLSYGAVLTLAERQGVRVAASTAVLALNLGLDVLLIPRFGLRGALVASIVSDLALHAVCAVAAWKDYRSPLLDRRAAALLLGTAAFVPLVTSGGAGPALRAVAAVALAAAALSLGVAGPEWGTLVGQLGLRTRARVAPSA